MGDKFHEPEGADLCREAEMNPHPPFFALVQGGIHQGQVMWLSQKKTLEFSCLFFLKKKKKKKAPSNSHRNPHFALSFPFLSKAKAWKGFLDPLRLFDSRSSYFCSALFVHARDSNLFTSLI